MKKSVYMHINLILFFGVLLSCPLEAEEIHFKNGNILKGQIIDIASNNIRIKLEDGKKVSFSMEDIESIQYVEDFIAFRSMSIDEIRAHNKRKYEEAMRYLHEAAKDQGTKSVRKPKRRNKVKLGKVVKEKNDAKRKARYAKRLSAKLSKLSNKHFKIHDKTRTLTRGQMTELMQALMTARKNVGKDLGFYPKDQIRVMLVPNIRKGTGGIFYRSGRKIFLRVPPQKVKNKNFPDERRALTISRIKGPAVHEYTHAVMSYQCVCPPWLEEGLASYEAAKYGGQPPFRHYPAHKYENWDDLMKSMARLRKHLTSSSQTRQGYHHSMGLISYMVEKKGMGAVS